MRLSRLTVPTLLCALVVPALAIPLAGLRPTPVPVVNAKAPSASAPAFGDVARVLRHPRCLNCHPSGDRPHVGDDARLHAMNVQRGKDDQGRIGQRCLACHRDENQELTRVPGAPHWHLAPRSMAWEGLDDHELAESLKDLSKNGGRSLEALRRHVAEDPLVLWGWSPGVGREAIPVSHEAFLASFDAWVGGGAASPAPGLTTTF